MKTPFVWLGSGRAQKAGVGPQGVWLDQACRAGLPVPRGGILLDDFFRLCLRMNVAVVTADAVAIPSAHAFHRLLYDDVRFPRLPAAVAISTIYSAPGEGSPHADVPAARRLAVDVQASEPLADAFCHVWSAALAAPAELRRDVLVTEMVGVRRSGSATSGDDAESDWVIARSGVVSPDIPGHARGMEFRLPRKSRRLGAGTDESGYRRRLQLLLNGLRRTFSEEKWQMKWADDGQVCWLLDIKPVES